MYKESKLIPETVEHFVAENTKYKLKWQQYLLEMARFSAWVPSIEITAQVQ